MRRWLARASIVTLLVSPMACSLLVDLSPLGGDGGAVDASSADAQDASVDQVVETEASTADVLVDAGPDVRCATPEVGNTITVPTGGLGVPYFPSGPLLSGDYILTSGRYWCIGCSASAGVVVGGLRVTVTGPDVSVERRLDFVTSNAQTHVLDRWHGTFDQLKQQLVLIEDCPEAGAAQTWYAYVPIAADGGSTSLLMVAFPDVKGTNPDSGVPVDFEVTFSRK